MKQLTYKCNLRPEKMPAWLTCILQITLDSLNRGPVLDGSSEDYEYIRWVIDEDLKQLQVSGDITTEQVTDEGQTVLFIKRSGRILASIYLK